MTRILFQGDSITDAGRDRNSETHLGSGYPKFVAGALALDNPGEYEFINKGISGNRIVDVYARIKADIINLKPDVMSIMIGVNDVWHELSRQNGVAAEKFERIYDMLISEVLEELPDLKVIILSPYVMPGTSTEALGLEEFQKEVALRVAAAKRIAEKYGFAYVDMQEKFNEAAKGDVARLTTDGVHPVAGGIELIKRAWLDAYKSL